MELCLYNAVLTSMSSDGKKFTYACHRSMDHVLSLHLPHLDTSTSLHRLTKT